MRPYKVFGPGDLIADELDYRNWTQKNFAEAMEISPKHASELINNRVIISPEIAIKLSGLFQQSPQFWLNTDHIFRLRQVDKKKLNKSKLRGELYSKFPVYDLKKLGWINPKSNKTLDLNIAISQLIGFENFDNFFNDMPKMCAKSSDSFKEKFNSNHAKVWLKKAQLESNKLSLPQFDKDKLTKLSNNIHNFTKQKQLLPNFISKLKKCGVGFIFLPHLSQTYLDGAVFYNEENPIIVYTARHNRLDNFWFTILHEIGHIILGHLNDKQLIVDSDDYEDKTLEETEANKYAKTKIGLDKIYDSVKNLKKIHNKRLLKLFEDFNYLHPSIIIGSLQYKGRISYRNYNRYKTEVRDILKQHKA